MTTIVYDHKARQIAIDSRMTRDIYSGGKVHVYDIASARFLE